MPPIFNAPLHMPTSGWTPPPVEHVENDHLTHNMRLSEPCPVKRVAYDFMDEEARSERYGSFSQGTAMLGHLLASIWIHESFGVHGEEHYPEAEIMWDYGVSHIDVFIPPGSPDYGLYEIKTTSKKRLTPVPDNYEQVKRQLYALRLMGMHDVPATIVIIGKSGIAGGIVGDPYPVSLTDDDIDRLDDEWAFVNKLAACALEHGTLRPLKDEIPSWCRCSKCVPAPKQDASAELEDLIESDYALYIDQYQESVDWYESIREKIKDIAGSERMEYVTSNHIVKIAKNGALSISRKPV